MDSYDISSSGRRVREASAADAAVLAEIYRPYVEETAVSFELAAPDAGTFAGRISETLAAYPFLVCETEDGEALGYAYASRFHPREAYDWSAEVSVYVRQDARGAGVGRALYTELERLLKEQGVRNLYACVAVPRKDNTNLTNDSMRFHAALGFTFAGSFCRCGNKFSQWYDVWWMEKKIGEYDPDPAPFLPYPELKKRR